MLVIDATETAEERTRAQYDSWGELMTASNVCTSPAATNVAHLWAPGRRVRVLDNASIGNTVMQTSHE